MPKTSSRSDRTAAAVGLAKAVVAHVYGVTPEDLSSPKRFARATRARQVAMYLSAVVLNMTPSEIARAFSRHRATAIYACQRIEDMRDNAEMDRTLCWLESLVRTATGADA